MTDNDQPVSLPRPQFVIKPVSEDPLSVLEESKKDMWYMRPLQIQPTIACWQHDAKDCILLAMRMSNARLAPQRVWRLITRWAARLLWYAPHLGLDEFEKRGGYITNSAPPLKGSYYWLVTGLEHIVLMDSVSFMFEARVDLIYRSSIITSTSDEYDQMKCGILNTPSTKFDNLVRYTTALNDSKLITSEPVGNKTLRIIETKIRRGLSKHTDRKHRNKMVRDMEKRYGGKDPRARLGGKRHA